MLHEVIHGLGIFRNLYQDYFDSSTNIKYKDSN
jgi:hypothetical protein